MGHSRTLRQLRTLSESVVRPRVKEVKRSVCSCEFVLSALKTLILIILYYSFSIGLTFYNQRFIHHFTFPLSITMTHLVVKFMLAGVVRVLLECKSKTERVTLPWGEYIKKIAPTGIVSALDIGLSNWSWEFITVSLYTMTKSSAVLFILFFAIVLRLEKFRFSLVFVVAFISVGLFLFTYQSTQFNLEGFLMVISASLLSGLRWTLAQMVTQKKELGLSNPLDMIYHVQPWMILGLFPLSVGFEGLHIATSGEVFNYRDNVTLIANLGLLLAGAVLAFFLEFSEFLLVAQTSSLTLSISGIFKEICTLYLAFEFNGDKMSSINGIGLVICLLGIAIHVIIKAVYGQNENKARVERLDASMEMLIKNGEANAATEDEDEVDLFNIKNDR
ncbi:solute carrier family 35 member C2-like [Liolophura sinensis]|uniref:solute carrier family 35 member C2-like n=1 Tax=Liolophura sinensis TaxID=3198878 RepID=UPI003158ACC0